MIGRTNADGISGIDPDLLNANPSDVMKGKTFGGSGSDEPQVGTLELTGNAANGQVLSGSTYYSKDAKTKNTGTMANQGAKSASLNCGVAYTIPAGYHNGSGKITANSLSSQTSATANAGQILTGQTAWVNGNKLTGTMSNRGAVSQSLGINGSYTIPAGYHNGSGKVTQSISTQGGSTTIPGTANKTIVAANRYVTGNIIVAGDPDLIPANIRAGKNIFGIVGTAQIYDRDELYIINGNVISSIFGGTFNWTPAVRGGATWVKETDGQKVRFDSYGYYHSSSSNYMKSEDSTLITRLPAKKTTYSKFRIEYEISSKSSYMTNTCSISFINNSEKSVGSFGYGDKGVKTGTFDCNISAFDNTLEYYIKFNFYSSIEGTTSPPTGGYIKIKKAYFTN